MGSYNSEPEIYRGMPELLLCIMDKIALLIRQNNKKEIDNKPDEAKKGNHNKFPQQLSLLPLIIKFQILQIFQQNKQTQQKQNHT